MVGHSNLFEQTFQDLEVIEENDDEYEDENIQNETINNDELNEEVAMSDQECEQVFTNNEEDENEEDENEEKKEETHDQEFNEEDKNDENQVYIKNVDDEEQVEIVDNELNTSFILKNILTQGKAPKRYKEKNGIQLYKCDHTKRKREYDQKINKQPINKIQEERQMRLLERLYHADNSSSDDDRDSKLRDLKSQYQSSLIELARAHNTIDSLRFGISKSHNDLNEAVTSKVNTLILIAGISLILL